ncbi:AraC-type DNA-binding protein [Paenibacillus sp. UNCCL117]|uniref:helix-turn-helix domain-containing protein n=1 Tax=unclassified Paenibacillus TaxID=185978 RepID=UPI00088FB70B|nr:MULTISPECIES: AraC family transcriptional regulator [unclassified Paenibacillus]SDD07140.1 AraC-type DNA-binding protein [Paenibacillus sp. cl123]SFW31547.1 AraC-type DNA-binding protein [Paenibacillus sp. UNCCL117]
MYPQYMFEFPNIDSDFPFHMKKKTYTSVSSHRHDFIEFSLVLEGTGTERINGTEHELLPGSMVLLLPYQIHEYRARAGESLVMFICNFDMRLLTAGPEAAWGLKDIILGKNSSQPAYTQLQGEAYSEGLALWERLYREHEGALAWRPIMLRALLLEALSLYVRSSGAHAPASQPQPPSRAAKSIWPVVQYVYEHYLDALSLGALSERFQIHPTRLSKQFGETFGIHFVDLLHELRVRHACSLLLSSDLPISQVAYESGFSSFPTFSRAFLRIRGMTPREYRERQLKDLIRHDKPSFYS